MLNFLVPKTKVRYYGARAVPIEEFEVIGIGQINPYCPTQFDNEIFITVVDVIENSKEYDEKEGLVLADYFSVRRCPKCHRLKLIPTKIRLSGQKPQFLIRKLDDFDDGNVILAYCNSCSSCFEFDMKENDIWLKEARKLKEKNLLTGWDKYSIER